MDIALPSSQARLHEKVEPGSPDRVVRLRQLGESTGPEFSQRVSTEASFDPDMSALGDTGRSPHIEHRFAKSRHDFLCQERWDRIADLHLDCTPIAREFKVVRESL
jgi:hypothetical protein